ncbi:MAG: hypothetical protein ACTTG4_05100 [Moraxella sp.]
MKNLFLLSVLMLSAMTAMPSVAKTNVSKSDFDDSVTISTQPSWVECPQSKLMCPLVGYAWGDGDAIDRYAVLVIEISDSLLKSYQSIERLKLNIDGDITELSKLTPNGTTSYSHDQVSAISRDYFIIPLDKLKSFESATSVKMQVTTNKNLYNMIYKGGKKQTRAYKMLPEFLSAVKENIQK